MKRDFILFVEDILEGIKNIEDFSKELSEREFMKDKLRQSAIVRQIEIIGKAVKNIPEEFRKKYLEVEWKKIAGTRDVIIHAYFGIDLDLMWKVIEEDIPELKKQIEKILKEERKNKVCCGC